jgi:hypothetical protein
MEKRPPASRIPLMWRSAQMLRPNDARGSIDFDLVESTIFVDDKGRPSTSCQGERRLGQAVRGVHDGREQVVARTCPA